MYIAHYDPLARLATLLVGDVGTAEQIVQDSFVSLHGAWRRMRDRDQALSYLRHDVVNRSRSIPEHDMASAPHAVGGTPAVPAAGRPIAPLAAAAMIAALSALPPRQREALVLSFYLDLSHEQVASAMGIGPAAAKDCTAEAMAALRCVMGPETQERPSVPPPAC
jgi:DNA-directed RNA polymerase specialized sigma24 family protein